MKAPQSVTDSTPDSAQDAVAVIGMACRFAGGEGYRSFWKHLQLGQDLIREIPPERWPIDGFYSPDFDTPNRSISKWGSFLDEVAGFDNRFFEVSPREAREMDPQQRLLLEETWRCVEDAGVALEPLREGRTGVWVGMMARDYELRLRDGGEAVDSFECSGNFGNMLANRVSHFFGWRGPSVAIDTACSSSLVALHEARLALAAGSVDYAVVAGVSLILAPWRYLSFSKARMLSPDGRCKTFDASANGYVPGEGIAVLLLQREKARRARRLFAHGLLRGSAVNHGGASVSLTAPRLGAQREVIREAFASAGLRPEAASYVEAHGTGTSLGDPIEFEALSQVFGERTREAGYCALGSVKTNLGHLEPAAGLAGVIKVLLMMKHRTIAPSLHLKQPNPMIAVAGSPFRFVGKAEDWRPRAGGWRAGVSSFGFGGVNAHVVLEAASTAKSKEIEAPDIFVLSAKSEASLRRMVDGWREFCGTEEFESAVWGDVCATLRRREAFEHRFAYYGGKAGLAQALNHWGPNFAEKGKPVCLAIGTFAGVRAAEARQFFEADPGLRAAWNAAFANVAKEFAAKGRKAARELKPAAWKGAADLLELTCGMAVANAVCRWVPGVQAVSGEGSGFDVALCWSGAAELARVFRARCGKAKAVEIGWPRVPVFDPLEGSTIPVVEIPREYWQRVLAQAVLADADWKALTAKAAELVRHQHTFRHLMEAEARALGVEGEEVEAWVLRLAAEESAHSERGQFLALAAGNALRVLQRKWDLPERYLPDSAAFREVLEWLGRGWVRLERVGKILRGEGLEEEDLRVAGAEGLFGRDARTDRRGRLSYAGLGPLPCLREFLERGSRPGRMLRAGTRPKPSGEFLEEGTVLRLGREGKGALGLDFARVGEWLAARWAEGVAVAWDATPFQDEGTAVALPTYVFDRTDFWVAPLTAKSGAAAAKNRGRQDRRISAAQSALLESHRIAGRCLVPAAYWVQQGGRVLGDSVSNLEAFEVSAPLWLDTEKGFEIEASADGFEVRSEGRTLARGKGAAHGALRTKGLGEAAARETDWREVPVMGLYERLTALGYEYGSALRVIRALRVSESRTVAELEVPQDGEWNAYLIDGLLQTGIAAALETRMVEPGLWVPHRIERIEWRGQVAGSVQAVIRTESLRKIREGWEVHIEAFDHAGELVWQIEGARFSRVDWAERKASEMVPTATKPPAPRSGKSLGQIRADLRQILARILEVDAGEVDGETDLREYGMESIGLTEYAEAIGNELGIEVDPVVLYERPTVHRLADFLSNKTGSTTEPAEVATNNLASPSPMAPSTTESVHGEPPRDAVNPMPRADDIAIIGMAGRFPGAANLDEFWHNLVGGKDSVSEVPEDRWKWRDYFGDPRTAANTTPSKWGGFLAEADRFDAAFFKISPREAELMDPQQRWALEVTWETLEDAGIVPGDLKGGQVGVFVGACNHDYQALIAGSERAGEAHAATGNYLSIIPNRISYFFDWKGPSLAIDTACSSSLVALDAAIKALTAGDCSVALAGGVNLCCAPGPYLSFGHAGMLSPSGRCKTFDAAADGYVRGEGVGLVLLKPLTDALREGDRIHAVIKGSAVSHGGVANSLTAPNPNAQAELLVRASERAGIPADSIGYIEAHGTGTQLGDPIEFAGLKAAFGILRERTGAKAGERGAHCGLGSVKTNIGHLESAAGIAGVIKAALALKHATLPATLHFRTLNPHIDLMGSPFYVVRETQAWATAQDEAGRAWPRRCGVSSFGFGGANAHIILEESPRSAERETAESGEPQIIVLSAQSEQQLEAAAKRLSEWLKGDGRGTALADLAHTLQCGRTAFECRLALVASDIGSVAERLGGDWRAGEVLVGNANARPSFGKLGAAQEDLDFCAALVRAGNLARLAEFWVSGSRIHWKTLFPGRRGQVVSLPSYPFARTKFWVPQTAAAAPMPTAAQRESSPVSRLLEKTWVERPLPGESRGLVGTCLVLVDGDRANAVAAELQRRNPNGWLFVAREGNVGEQIPAMSLDFESTEAAARLVGQCPPLRGLVHLALGDTSARHSWEPGVVALYQNLVNRFGPNDFSILLVTGGVQPWKNNSPTLRGAALTGLVRMLGAEHAGLRARAVDLEGSTAAESTAGVVEDELGASDACGEVCHRGGVRFGPVWRARVSNGEQAPQIREDQAYLIAGGAGGIGLNVARHLIRRGARKLALLGQQVLPEPDRWDECCAAKTSPQDLLERIGAIRELESLGAAVEYGAVSLEDGTRVAQFMSAARTRFGGIAGVVHCAGQVDREIGPFIGKNAETFRRVLAPKVEGTQILARQFENEPLDFFVTFSSVAAAIPGLAVGYSDYAMANAFQDFFVAWQRARGKRWFRSVNWPLWDGVGMGRGVAHPKYASYGLRPLSIDQGLEFLDRVLGLNASGNVFPVVLESEAVDVQGWLETERRAQSKRESQAGRSHGGGALLDEVRQVFARGLGIPAERLDPDLPFGEFGVDSIILADVTRRLDRLVGRPVDPSALLEHPTLAALTKYLERTGATVVGRTREAAQQNGIIINGSNTPKANAATTPVMLLDGVKECAQREPIAIIGMGCRFPGAEGTEEFWEKLRAGIDCIGEVPPERWSQERYFDGAGAAGRTISKWGGFIDEMAMFDPGYFEISDEQAEQMDPIARIFLEVAAGTLAQAGYARKELAGATLGVFVGSRSSGYGSLIEEFRKHTIVGIGQNFIAAQVSHFFDWRGPSLVVDTACSSSLASVHLACQSLWAGECEAALAGGADVLLDERVYLMLTQAKALSADGRCHTFDERANGYVPGEGAGAVLLKPLSRALRDGDRIEALILGAALNNDGRTMGMTTPSLEGQQAVIEKALAQARVEPRSIGYVEAHGTGTMIGDPIELRALSSAFRKQTQESGFCAIGSVKTNVGHLHSAAGIASLLKVALALQHAEIPPTLHCEQPNPRFDFANSPFYPNRAAQGWKERNGTRRSGVSSFGFGGTNCHAILEAFQPAQYPAYRKGRAALPPPVFQRRRFWPEQVQTVETQSTEANTVAPPAFLVLQEET